MSRLKRVLGLLALACASVIVGFFVLEVVARVALPGPRLYAVRDGIYDHRLEILTGRSNSPWQSPDELERLPVDKRRGETRIFVFGESSVQGAPFEQMGSPPTMLYDQLVARFPERDITVVNMGRGSARIIESYYFLLGVERYAPDIIIFYQGGNDYFTEFEACAPVRTPRLHAAWRALVRRSFALWGARAIGPGLVYRMWPGNRHSSQWERDELCDGGAGFEAWTEIALDAALDTGAAVFVATHVVNPLWLADRQRQRDLNTDGWRDLMQCALSDECEMLEVWRRVQPKAQYHDPFVTPRGDAWKRAARDRGVRVIDFAEFVETEREQGFAPRMFTEEVHLSLEGYWNLAWMMAEAIAPLIDSEAVASDEPPPFEPDRYYRDVSTVLATSITCIYFTQGARLWRAGNDLLAASMLRNAVDFEEAGESAGRARVAAQLLMGAMRQELGIAPGLRPELAMLLENEPVLEAVRSHNDWRACPALPVPDA